MTTLQKTPSPVALTETRLPSWAPVLAAVASAGVGALLWLLGSSLALSVFLAVVLFLVVLPAWSAAVESRRAAADRLATGLVWTSFSIAMLPLIWLVVTVLRQGLTTVNIDFLTYSMRNVIGDAQGGLYHALIGTLLEIGRAHV